MIKLKKILFLIGLMLCNKIYAQITQRTLGNKSYEVSNHLGNVMTVVSDRKTPTKQTTTTTVAFNETDIKSFNDYYPYGMVLENRSLSEAEAHRFGFQGQEKDDEVKGKNNSINYKYRIHDPRLGRFFAEDPLVSKYPYYSSNQFSGNRVVDAIEFEGLEPVLNENNVIIGYDVQEGQGFTQIIEDIIKYQSDRGESVEAVDNLTWKWLAKTNSELLPKNISELDWENPNAEVWKHLNINKGDYLKMPDYIVTNQVNFSNSEVISYTTDIKVLSNSSKYKRSALAKWEEEVFEPWAFNVMTNWFPVISTGFSASKSITGKEYNSSGISRDLGTGERITNGVGAAVGLFSLFGGGITTSTVKNVALKNLEHEGVQILISEGIENTFTGALSNSLNTIGNEIDEQNKQ